MIALITGAADELAGLLTTWLAAIMPSVFGKMAMASTVRKKTETDAGL
jgi:hypothetical protein